MNFKNKIVNINNLKIKFILVLVIILFANIIVINSVTAETKAFERFKSLTASNTILGLGQKVNVNLNMAGVYPIEDTITLKLYDVSRKKNITIC